MYLSLQNISRVKFVPSAKHPEYLMTVFSSVCQEMCWVLPLTLSCFYNCNRHPCGHLISSLQPIPCIFSRGPCWLAVWLCLPSSKYCLVASVPSLPHRAKHRLAAQRRMPLSRLLLPVLTGFSLGYNVFPHKEYWYPDNFVMFQNFGIWGLPCRHAHHSGLGLLSLCLPACK